ncbi:MAG: hypothetical protein ACYCQK_02770 [Acidiferrobacteraceae bacterium]
MSYFVVVTFDLHGAQPKNYARVKTLLAKLKLEKQIRVKGKSHVTRLPANTFAAKYRGTWNKKSAKQLRDHLRAEIKKAITMLRLRATVLVVVGDHWAWGRQRI